MNPYQIEQLESLTMIRRQIDTMDAATRKGLLTQIDDYLLFRRQVADFSSIHFSDTCTRKCYQSRLSACCAKDGILAFFADMVVNLLVSDSVERDRLEQSVRQPRFDYKCVYLSEAGCVWKIKPVICEFFLCDAAEKKILKQDPGIMDQWQAFKTKRLGYTWPDRPVLFEYLESFFLGRGCDSALMYLHKSPGLVMIRRKRDGVK